MVKVQVKSSNLKVNNWPLKGSQEVVSFKDQSQINLGSSKY